MTQPVLTFGRHILNLLETGITKEWFLTNGLGGYASGTVVGVNSRRYHALLMHTTARLERQFLVSRVEESLVLQGHKVELSSQEYPGTISPQGYLHIESFTFEPFPQWIYCVGGVKIRKTILLRSQDETLAIRYEHLTGPSVSFGVRPFFTCRNQNELTTEDDRFRGAIQISGQELRCEVKNFPVFFMRAAKNNGEKITIEPENYWYRNLLYAQEEERGLDHLEDHFSPAKVAAELSGGDSLTLVFTLRENLAPNFSAWHDEELFLKRHQLENLSFDGSLGKHLVQAAAQLIVQTPSGPQIIAGYPWQGSSVRESLMSLPGLCLATGRTDDARQILLSHAKHLRYGLLPLELPQSETDPFHYTLDGSLWWVWAAQKFWKATGDVDFLKQIKPMLDKIIGGIQLGVLVTDPKNPVTIRMEPDGFLWGSAYQSPLTWMSKKIGEWVATPRKGKPVEVQALWYNALSFYAEVCMKCGVGDQGSAALAQRVRDKFNLEFFNAQTQYLHDVIDETRKESSIRPNALWAMSLPYEALDSDKFRAVFETARQKLYTSLGLRTLSPEEPHFYPIYKGDETIRAQAQHNGTVFGFLIGPFLNAFFKVYGCTQPSKEIAYYFLQPFISHLSDAGLGAVSELFDGSAPHFPRGGIASARSTGELLRVIWEEKLNY